MLGFARSRISLANLSRAISRSWFPFLCLGNLFVMLFLVGTNRLATNDEARHISSGVAYWRHGDFLLGDDSPPLSRMISTIPLLPFRAQAVHEERATGEIIDPAGLRDRELTVAGVFLHLNPEPFYLVVLARMTNFGWWVLGGWIIARWANQLHGRMAEHIAIAIWSTCPVVLGHEQLTTPDFSGAVTCLGAAYALSGYLLRPSWGKALLAGFALGVASLVTFAALALLVTFPILGMLNCARRAIDLQPPVGFGRRGLQTVLAFGMAAYIINLGYGFDRSGMPLGSFRFTSRALGGEPHQGGAAPASSIYGNRFRGSWLGQVMVPVPAAYLQGLDRRWRELEVPRTLDDPSGGLPTPSGGGPDPTVVGDLPLALLIVALCSSIVEVLGRGGLGSGGRLAMCASGLVFAAMTATSVHLSQGVLGVLLVAPFLILLASGVATSRPCASRSTRWIVASLAAWCVGSCLATSMLHFCSVDRTTRFRQDLVRQSRKLGVDMPSPPYSVGNGLEERGLTYRRLTDVRGRQVNYALFVPASYHGDRPFPLILFLHGWGDRKHSESDRMYTEVGLPFTLKYHPIDFFVLIPQGQSGYWQEDGEDARMALELLAVVQDQYRIDPKRISLSGLSSGGSGVWALASQDPGRWAAIVPVASSCDSNLAPRIKDIPCWCFHNRYDHGFSAREPREMVAALKQHGGHPLYTEYSDTNHNAGERAYASPELYAWLSRQRSP